MRFVLVALWLGLTATCAFAFYDRYWRWRACFNELGRCFDPEEGVMLEQAGLVWGSLGGLFGLLLLWSVLRLLRQRTAPQER